MLLTIMDTLNKWNESVKGFFLEYGDNPLLWIGLFGLGLLIFFLTYSALHRN